MKDQEELNTEDQFHETKETVQGMIKENILDKDDKQEERTFIQSSPETNSENRRKKPNQPPKSQTRRLSRVSSDDNNMAQALVY